MASKKIMAAKLIVNVSALGISMESFVEGFNELSVQSITLENSLGEKVELLVEDFQISELLEIDEDDNEIYMIE